MDDKWKSWFRFNAGLNTVYNNLWWYASLRLYLVISKLNLLERLIFTSNTLNIIQFDNDSQSGAQPRYRSRPTSRANSRSGSVISERARELVLAPSKLPMPDDRMTIEPMPMPSSSSSHNGRFRKHGGEKLIKPELRPGSRGSRMSYTGDLMHWPPEETASVVS